MKPQRGDVAVCSRGWRGLITEDKPKVVTYPDGTKGEAWVGVNLEPGREGKPWSSRNPKVQGSLVGMLAVPD